MSPARYGAKILANQLIDEWEYRTQKAAPSPYGPNKHREAIHSFLSFIDENESIPAERVRLDENPEIFLKAFHAWEQARASSLAPTSSLLVRQPLRLLALVSQRASRSLKVSPSILERCKRGASYGSRAFEHLDEFSRTELEGFMRQARKDMRTDRRRLERFRELSSSDGTAQGNPFSLSGLLRDTRRNELEANQLKQRYATPFQLPFDVKTYADALQINLETAKNRIWTNTLNLLHRLVYATEKELVPPLVMLMYKTGITYGELQSLRVNNITDEGTELYIRTFKRRANSEMTYRFPITPQDRKSRWSIYGLFQYLIWLTEPAREEADGVQEELLLMVHYVSNGRRYVKQPTHRKYRLVHWFKENGLTYTSPATWGRLRKSHHTVRSKGKSDPRAARSGHSTEVFEKHYLSTTTVLERSGISFIQSADFAFQRVTKGPVVAAEWSSDDSARSDGSIPEQARKAILEDNASDRSATVGKCIDMDSSPFGSKGFCSDQVRLCMLCPNALILIDHLPQVLMLEDHLTELRKLSNPVQFNNHYGPVVASIHEVLAKFTQDDISVARKKIDSGDEFLSIPVSMRVGF
jgi:integrase